MKLPLLTEIVEYFSRIVHRVGYYLFSKVGGIIGQR